MTGSNSYRPRHSHPINGLSLIPQHVLNSNRNTPSPRLSRPAVDPFKAFTASDLDGFVDSITSKIRNALLGKGTTDPQPQNKTHPRSSDVFGKLESIQASNHSDLGPRPGPSGSQAQSAGLNLGNTVRAEEESDNDDGSNDSNDDDSSIQPKLETASRGSQVPSPTSQSAYSSSDADSDAANLHPESDDQHSDSSSNRGPASQDGSPCSSPFLNDNVSHDPEDLGDSMHGSISSSISGSSDSLQISSGPQFNRGRAPKEIIDEAEYNSSSSSIVFQPRHSEKNPPISKRPFSPNVGSSRVRESSHDLEGVDDDDLEESKEGYEDEDTNHSRDDISDSDPDVEGNGDDIDVNDVLASTDVNLDGEELGAAKLSEKELEDGEIEEGELMCEDNTDLNPRDDREQLIAGDIMVDETFNPLCERTQDPDRNMHPGLQRVQGPVDVDNQNDDHSRIGLKMADQPSAIHSHVLPVTKMKKLSRTGSFSADGAMIFRPSSESSLNFDSDQATGDEYDFDKIQATGNVDGSPIIEHHPQLRGQSESSPSSVLNQSQLQLSHRPEIHCANSELVPDDNFLPINPASEPERGPDKATVVTRLLPDDMCIGNQDLQPDLDVSPQIVLPLLDPRQTQPAPNQAGNSLAEEQIEDDNDLFEGDEDLRLHRLGLDKSRQNEDASLPTVAPSDEVEDRFSSIEQKLESFIARTAETQHSELEERTRGTVQEPPLSSTACSTIALTTTQFAAAHAVVQQPLETGSHAADNSTDLTAVEDVQLNIASAEILQQTIGVTQPENISVGTLDKAQSRTSPADQDDPAQTSLQGLWGEVTSVNGVSQVTEESRMNEINFFPLKPSSCEIFNAASWTPALSANIATNPDDSSTQLNSATDVNPSIISLTLPQRPNLRQTVNLDEDLRSIDEAPIHGSGHQNLRSKTDPQKSTSSHDQEDYDMLASSLTDGNSEIVEADPTEDRGKVTCNQDIQGASDENLKSDPADKAHQDKPQDGQKMCNEESIQHKLCVNTKQSAKSSQNTHPPCEYSVGSPSASKKSVSIMDETDMLLSQFIKSSPEVAGGPNLHDQPVLVSPTQSSTVVPAVTFATSPPVEMDRYERFDHHSDAEDMQLGVAFNVEQPNSAFEPHTPRTSTTVGQGTSSESSERHLSRGSAYSAPSSVISSDAASVPASVAPPPPLHNASMGAPTEAVGLSNQLTRRSSIDSSTHAEPPSPSTSTRHRSAPMSQEQVNAPGLPHIEAAEAASSSGDLPDPLRSPPPFNQQLIPICPAEINMTPISRASSMMAHPPSPSCSNLLEGSHMSIGTSHRDASPQFDPRASLPDPIATPLPVSIPAIKLEDLPNACLSIERHRSINSSADSQPATSPRFEKFSSSISAPAKQGSGALIEKNVQAVGAINPSSTNAFVASPAHAIATHLDQPGGPLSPRTSKLLDTDKPSEESQEPPIAVINLQAPQTQPTENEKDGEITNQKDILKMPIATSARASPLVDDQVDSKHDSTTTETTTLLPDLHEDRALRALRYPLVDVQPDSTVNEESVHVEFKLDRVDDHNIEPTVDAKPDPTAGEARNPSELVEPLETSPRLGPTTRYKRKRQSTPKDSSGAARLREIKAEEQAEQDRESQLREILRKRRASKQLTPQAVPESQERKRETNQISPSAESKKTKILKREAKSSKADSDPEGEIEYNDPSDATEVESKGPPIRSRLPRAAKRSSMAPNSLAPPAQIRSPSIATTRSTSPRPPPSSPLNTNIGDESSSSLLVSGRDDLSLAVGYRRSSRNSRSTTSPVVPASTVSVMVPRLQAEDMIPKLRLHQHNSKNKLFNLQIDQPNLENSQQSSTEATEPKLVLGPRIGRRKQSEGTEGRQLPPSLPPVTRSHCHFIRLQFPKATERSFDTFLVPQCATGEEVIKKKMKELEMIEDDNLTGEEQSRGVRIGPDGLKHSEERLEHPVLLSLKPEYSTFAVDEETLNILIEIFGLSLIQDGQVEVLLPKAYFSRFDDENGYEELGDRGKRSECDRELSVSSLSSRNEPHLSHGGSSQACTSRNSHNRHNKRRAQSPPSSLYSRTSSPRSSSFLSPTEPKAHHKRRRSNQVEES